MREKREEEVAVEVDDTEEEDVFWLEAVEDEEVTLEEELWEALEADKEEEEEEEGEADAEADFPSPVFVGRSLDSGKVGDTNICCRIRAR